VSHPLRAATAVVGVADAVDPSGELAGSTRAIELDVIRAALVDAGCALADVDGLFCCVGAGFMPAVELAEHLRIEPSWIDSTQTGGSSFEVAVDHVVFRPA
jgi:hypothetical protein